MDQEQTKPINYLDKYSVNELFAKALDRLARTQRIIREQGIEGDILGGQSPISINLMMGEIVYPDGSRQSFMDEKGIIRARLPKFKNEV